MYDVSGEHTLRDACNVKLQYPLIDAACTRREGYTLVAASHKTRVSLQRLSTTPTLRHEPLASVEIAHSFTSNHMPAIVLFCQKSANEVATAAAAAIELMRPHL